MLAEQSGKVGAKLPIVVRHVKGTNTGKSKDPKKVKILGPFTCNFLAI